MLKALRPEARGRLALVFGAGERDTGKRPLMGRVAHENADLVWVTDDNPRSEDPAAIRAEISTPARTPSKLPTAARPSPPQWPILARARCF